MKIESENIQAFYTCYPHIHYNNQNAYYNIS